MASILLDTASRVQCLYCIEPVLYIQYDPSACPVDVQQHLVPSATRPQAGPLIHEQRSPRAVPWARVAGSGGAPRRCPEGRAFIPGVASRELPFGSACATAGGGAAPRCAPARTGPGPLDASSPLLLPAGRAPAAGESGETGATAWWAGRGGGAGSGREGGRAAGPAGSCSPHCPLEAAARTPGSGLRSLVCGCAAELGSREWGPTGRGGEGELRPLSPAGDARRQGRVVFSLRGFGIRGSPGGPKLRDGGCSLGGRELFGARPRSRRQTDPPRLQRAAGKASTST